MNPIKTMVAIVGVAAGVGMMATLPAAEAQQRMDGTSLSQAQKPRGDAPMGRRASKMRMDSDDVDYGGVRLRPQERARLDQQEQDVTRRLNEQQGSRR